MAGRGLEKKNKVSIKYNISNITFIISRFKTLPTFLEDLTMIRFSIKKTIYYTKIVIEELRKKG